MFDKCQALLNHMKSLTLHVAGSFGEVVKAQYQVFFEREVERRQQSFGKSYNVCSTWKHAVCNTVVFDVVVVVVVVVPIVSILLSSLSSMQCRLVNLVSLSLSRVVVVVIVVAIIAGDGDDDCEDVWCLMFIIKAARDLGLSSHSLGREMGAHRRMGREKSV